MVFQHIHSNQILKGLMVENIIHYILKQESPEIMLIIAIIGLFLIVFFYYFSKNFLQRFMVGLQKYNIIYTEIWQKLF